MQQTINGAMPLDEARGILARDFELKFTDAVEAATAPAFERLKGVVPAVEWPLLAPLIFEIDRLKREKDAIVLAHNFQSPQIFLGVADIGSDSLGLAREAANVGQRVIVQCGVRFMAETSKLLNPGKTVLLPDGRAGCSLAASITADDVRALRAQYPDAPVVAHINTGAEVKALSDVCCTSANALAIVEAVDGDTVIVLPDQYLARNIAARTEKKIITWAGACQVHETFTAADIDELRAAYPGARVLVHPQCPPQVVEAADYSGSTAGMVAWVKSQRPARVVLVTECSVSDNVAAETEGTEFVRGCNLCPHMKRITLENILWSLHTMTEEIVVDAALAEPAAAALRRMLELAPPDGADSPQ